MSVESLRYQIALTLIPSIGNITAKSLIAYCGGAEGVFKEKKQALLKIPGIGEKAISALLNSNVFEAVDEELTFLEQHNIQAHFFLDSSYPKRLTHCEDGPIILYSKGNLDLNSTRMVSIVGTRKATVKGRIFTEKLVEELSPYGVTIVSGLAYGIDVTAHKAALQNNLQTIGVLACGLDEIYPKAHTNVVEKMLQNGGITSDYRSKTELFNTNFPKRNRLVAGMADAVIVVESSKKGGSLITADLANGYNRDVFAVPGRPDDSQSVGCNKLIKANKAALIESAKDIEYIMGWQYDKKKDSLNQQTQLFIDLTDEEQVVYDALENTVSKGIDALSLEIQLPMSKTTSLLLNLEFKGLVKSLPGKQFQRI